MLEIKSWLEATGMKVAEECFFKPPALPYVIFSDDTNFGGADNEICIADRSISIELYSDRISREFEQKIENLLNEKAIKYKKNRTWVHSDKFFQTVYYFNLVEKI